MENAVISQIGGPETLYTRPANAFVADFVGEANIVPAKVIDADHDQARIQLGSVVLSAPYVETPIAGQSVQVIIRPEDILVAAENEEGLPGTVRFAMYQGSTNDYIVDTEVGELRIVDHQSKGAIRERGTQVSLSFREDHIFLIKDT